MEPRRREVCIPGGIRKSAALFQCVEVLAGRADLSREEDELRKLWSAAQTRKALLERLAESG